MKLILPHRIDDVEDVDSLSGESEDDIDAHSEPLEEDVVENMLVDVGVAVGNPPLPLALPPPANALDFLEDSIGTSRQLADSLSHY